METERWNPFTSMDEELQADAGIADAIRLGIEEIDNGRDVKMEEARERMEQWLLRSSSQIEH